MSVTRDLDFDKFECGVDDEDCNGAFFSKNPFANSRVIHILGIRKNDLRSSFSNSPSNYIVLM